MSLLVAGIAGAAALGSSAVNAVQSGKMNKRAEKFSREMWDKQGQREIDYWKMQNAYNDPSAQMSRLKDAGLNPNLVYGNGADTQSNLPSPSSPMAPPRYNVPNIDIQGVVQSALATQQAEANIARTKAETRSIDSRTAGTEFQNQLNNMIGIDQMANRYNSEVATLQTKEAKALHEYNAWQAGAFQGQPSDSKNSPIAKAIKAGYDQTLQTLQNSKKTGDIMSFEREIKKFEAGLAKQGISPNSPWYVKIVGDLITKVMGFSSLSEMTKQATQ